jgi:molybdate transport system permease protein
MSFLQRYFKHVASNGHTDWLFVIPSLLLLGLFGLPILALLQQAVADNYLHYALSQQALTALRLSLVTSLFSVAMAIALGTPLAYTLARWQFSGKYLIELLVDLPVVLPPSVAGLALLVAFGRQGMLGNVFNMFGIGLPFSSAAVIVAQTFVSAPLFIRTVRIGFSGVDIQLEEAAHVEGANQWQLFREVMLPLVGRSMVNGAILAWTRALGEFGATILFAGNLEGVTQTMPLAIYLGFENSLGMAIALSSVLVVTSIVLLTFTRYFERTQP